MKFFLLFYGLVERDQANDRQKPPGKIVNGHIKCWKWYQNEKRNNTTKYKKYWITIIF